MEKDKLFLIVTANNYETEALLADSDFIHKRVRSKDPDDTAFYNIGTFGHYNVVHFELNDQGSAKADAAGLAIHTAINAFHPCAVILLGIAFGKDFSDEQQTQKIGDVLISEKIADYESGKIKSGKLFSDGIIAESGRQLLSTFKYFSKTWVHYIDNEKAACEFGTVLSGDKVVDDKNFKKKLIAAYPRAIGGEMEGRGAYAACRSKNINEWIVVKAICDWADGTKSKDKKKNQKIAAKSATSLLHHIFMDDKSLEKVSPNTSFFFDESDQNGNLANKKIQEEEIVGYFINFGITTCRLFEILKNDKGLRESKVISYDVSDPNNSKYLSGIIDHVKNEILPETNKSGKHFFIKAFADACFSDIFVNEKKRNEFILEFYSQTSLYFNILSQKQTEENLKRLFKNIGSGTAIVNIGTQCVDLLVQNGKKYNMHNLKITLGDVSDYLLKHGISENWNEPTITEIKKYIKGKIISEIKNVKAKSVIIIKDELSFMTDTGYPLVFKDGCQQLSIEDYKKSNREYLFNVDFRKEANLTYVDPAIANRYYGFKNGHIILESIFECIGTEIIIPSNELSIHGNLNAYIFNVVISGSTKEDKAPYMVEAHKIMTDMGATVLSPRIVKGRLSKKTVASDVKHANAIRECDMLFVCNKDNYIGEQTGREIYGAYLLNKPIAFWNEPDNSAHLKYIPHEQWWDIMKVLNKEEN